MNQTMDRVRLCASVHCFISIEDDKSQHYCQTHDREKDMNDENRGVSVQFWSGEGRVSQL